MCIRDRLLEVQRFLPKSSTLKKDTILLLKNFECEEIYSNDKKMLKILDDFQSGLIKIDKIIDKNYFN